jgi:hypothetical protein
MAVLTLVYRLFSGEFSPYTVKYTLTVPFSLYSYKYLCQGANIHTELSARTYVYYYIQYDLYSLATATLCNDIVCHAELYL